MPIRSARPTDLIADNPTSKYCACHDDGMALYDSPVICECWTVWATHRVVPAGGRARFGALKLQAMGDAFWTRPCRAARAATPKRRRGTRPWLATKRHQPVRRCRWRPTHRTARRYWLDRGGVCFGVFGFPLRQRSMAARHPKLAAWFEEFSQNPGIARTVRRNDQPKRSGAVIAKV